MKALTEMKRRKQNTLISRYSLPQKLNFSILSTSTTSSSTNTTTTAASSFFLRRTTTTMIPPRAHSCSTLTTPSSSHDADSKIVVVCIPPTNNSKLTPKREVSTTTKFIAAHPKQGAMRIIMLPAKKNTTGKSSKKVKKKVSFQERDEILGIVSRQDISPKERNEIWYSRVEYETILRACSKQINMLDRGKHLKDRKFCARGLESNTRVQAGTKSMNRYLAYQAVLCEQERQIRAGVVVLDDKEIAQLYYATSYSCQLWARAVGLADQREAQDIHDDESEQEEESYHDGGGRGVGGGSEELSSAYLSSSGAATSNCSELHDVRMPPDEFVARAA